MDNLANDGKLNDEGQLRDKPSMLLEGPDGDLTAPSIESSKAKITLLHGQTFCKEIPAGPDTPNQENMDVAYSLNSPTSGSFEADISDGSPCTPIVKFDPFAPGPEDMERAPCKKVVKISRHIVPHRLVFDDSDDSMKHRNKEDDVETLSEEQIVENLYQTLLEAVIVVQSEAFFAENPSLDEISIKTPPYTMLIRASNVCPGAPSKKASTRTANIDTVRRKLEF